MVVQLKEEIDQINILNASRKAMIEAMSKLNHQIDMILTDAVKIKTDLPFEAIIKGDAKSYSIGAASIIAKVTRDRIMREWDKVYPEYGFESHKGYGTAKHITAIKEYGFCPLHRLSFTKKLNQRLTKEDEVHWLTGC